MTRFYIIRHGETDFNQQHRYQGQSEVPLNEIGRQQATALGDRLDGIPLDVFYTSDLSRAQETARLVARGRTVVLDGRLREIDVGRLVGLTWQDITQREPAYRDAVRLDPDTPFPGGESPVDVIKRTLEVFDVMHTRYPQGSVGVVTHGGVINLLVAHLLGLPLQHRRRMLISNCSLTIVEWSDERQRLHCLNDTAHLERL